MAVEPKLKILFLSSWFPYPPINGAKLRIWNLIKQLGADHDLTLISLANSVSVEEARKNLPEVQKYCHTIEVIQAKHFHPQGRKALRGYFSALPRSLYATRNPEFEQIIKQTIDREIFDLVIASEVMTISWPSILAARLAECAIIIDALEIGRYAHRGTWLIPFDLSKELRWYKENRLVYSVLKKVAACTVPSQLEKKNVAALAPKDLKIEVIPHCLDLADYPLQPFFPLPNTLVFMGSFSHYPNLDGIRFFLRDIFPLVKEKIPLVKLIIAGSLDGEHPEELSTDPAVHFVGLVSNIKPLVGTSFASIVPIRLGAGTRIKIIESMALGTPVISTSKGAEGLNVTEDEDILIADDPHIFAVKLVDLLTNPIMRQKLSENGRRLVESEYSTTTLKKKYDHLLNFVMNSNIF